MRRISIRGLPGEQPQNPVERAYYDALGALEACGHQAPDGISGNTLIIAIGGAFLKSELPPLHTRTNLSQSARLEIERTIRPDIAKRAEAGEKDALTVARQVGVFVAATIKHTKSMTMHPPIALQTDTLTVDQQHVPYSIEAGKIVEYGMGMNGLHAHIDNLSAGIYSVTGIQKQRGEATLLQGMAGFYGLGTALEIRYGGIAANTEDILRQGGTGMADLVVASRVHMAGRDLTAGIAAAPDLLREEGLLIARGPQSYKRGVGYSQVARQIHQDGDLGVIVDHRYTAPIPGGLEACRLIVAQEI